MHNWRDYRWPWPLPAQALIAVAIVVVLLLAFYGWFSGAWENAPQ